MNRWRGSDEAGALDYVVKRRTRWPYATYRERALRELHYITERRHSNSISFACSIFCKHYRFYASALISWTPMGVC